MLVVQDNNIGCIQLLAFVGLDPHSVVCHGGLDPHSVVCHGGLDPGGVAGDSCEDTQLASFNDETRHSDHGPHTGCILAREWTTTISLKVSSSK